MSFEKLLQHSRKPLIIIHYQNDCHLSLAKPFSGNILEICRSYYTTIGSSGTQTKRWSGAKRSGNRST
ncbi:protein of unknown function [Acidithiobacillus ferrivorans]|uniref:Uncharacterized protein n=1 Tax=Acidithiobacillus ferrivorans TaxID=160808 RepID=A0A060UWP2_9PROT|nr:hypothetical protein AFERRI_530068 [Acidithiobacillus ferrivorans]SMH67533.1 protein of unknown function [Acidithiobacillus ferrivorans]